MLVEDILAKVGIDAVEKYRQSFIENDRVATGKTNQSVSYEVDNNTPGVTVLKVTGRKDINQLEEGVSADEYAANPASFSALEEWISARGLNRTAESIDDGLRRNGWVSGNGPKGGTPNIITTPTQQVISEAKIQIEKNSKEMILKEIKI
tara:strand:- start:295 stop:744 length:450 start_codon:yes stop_codon:yes gene_type:complete